MTEQGITKWIKTNLGPVINQALGQSIYTEDWLGAMAQREVGFLIARYAGKPLQDVSDLMKGDYGQRSGESQNSYHGFSFWQIDIASYPDFIKSGDWKDPLKSCLKAIEVLEEKRKYLEQKLAGLKGDDLDRGNTAAYNCGPGNVTHALLNNFDVDHYTYNHNYSKEVWRFREIYKSL